MKISFPLFLVLVGLAASLHAQSIISVNLGESASNPLSSSDIAGVVAADNWNYAQDNNGSDPIATGTNLIDNTGAATTTDLSILGGSDVSTDSSGSTSTTNGTVGDRLMMSDQVAVQSQGDGIWLQLRDLPTAFASSGVDVYLYSWGATQASSAGNGRYNGIYEYQLDADGAGAGGFSNVAYMREYDPAAGNQNWPGFVNEQFATQGEVTAGSYSSYAKISIAGGFDATNGFDLRMYNRAEGGGRIMLQGFQIVQVPEPKTFGLLVGVLSVLPILARRRRSGNRMG